MKLTFVILIVPGTYLLRYRLNEKQAQQCQSCLNISFLSYWQGVLASCYLEVVDRVGTLLAKQ